jgi:hypothetical protein
VTDPYSSTEEFLANVADDATYSSEDMRFMLTSRVGKFRVDCVVAGVDAADPTTRVPVRVWRRSLEQCGVRTLATTYCVDPLSDLGAGATEGWGSMSGTPCGLSRRRRRRRSFATSNDGRR